jgi:nucleotide-binding universal stress UspA family protein
MLGPARRSGETLDGRAIQRREDAILYLQGQARTLADQGITADLETVVDRNAADAILAAAAAPDVDVLVMATHGRGGLSRLIVGSVTDQVLRRCRKPMLLYRPRPVEVPTQDLRDAFLVYGH